MGSGGSKAKDLKAEHGKERRASHVDTNPPPQSKTLVPCGTCDRKFAADRIQRHAEVRQDPSRVDKPILVQVM